MKHKTPSLMALSTSGQGSFEFLLLLAGAVVVSVIVLGFLFSGAVPIVENTIETNLFDYQTDISLATVGSGASGSSDGSATTPPGNSNPGGGGGNSDGGAGGGGGGGAGGGGGGGGSPPSSALCPNGVVNSGEVCDGGNQACTTDTGYLGTQSCLGDCSGYSSCATSESCGDAVKNGSESCDGSDFGVYGSGVVSCSSYNASFISGNLLCTNCSIDTSSCVGVVGFDITPPSAPENVTVSYLTSTSVRLSWSASTDNVGVTGYFVDVSTADTFTSFVSGWSSANVNNVLTIDVTGLSANTAYYMRVRAYDAAGNVSVNSVVGSTPLVNVSVPDASAFETGPDTGAFTLTRTGGTTSSLLVNFSLSGTASNGVDFQTVTLSQTIPAGSPSTTVLVMPVDDVLVEGLETVILSLSSGDGYGVGSSPSGTVTIADNDSAPTISASIVPSRLSGVAPLSVFFDATSTTATATTRPFHDLEYAWDFGDVTSGTWANGRSRNTAKGGVAAHVFDLPGDYLVSLVVRDGQGGVANQSVTISVQNPDVIFSGTNTICFSNTSDFTGCPVGATLTTTSNFSSVVSSIATGRRLLLKRGDRFVATAYGPVNVPGPGLIGAFGTCVSPDARGICSNAPIIDATSFNTNNGQIDQVVLDFIGYSGVNNVSDWRVTHLRVEGGINPTAGVGIGGISGFSNALLYRMSVYGFYTGMGSGLWIRANDQTSVVDSEVGFSYSNQAYFGANRLALLGNYFHDSYDSHVLRVWQSGKGVIQHNTLARSSIVNTVQGRHALKFHGPTETDISQFANLTRTQYTVISDNEIVHSGPWPVTIAPQNAGQDERLSNIIFERNHFESDGSATVVQTSLRVSARDVTVRNNIFDATGAKYYFSINVLRVGIEPAPDNVHIYNNLSYRRDSQVYQGDPFALVSVASEATNTRVHNNVISAPSLPANFVQQVIIGTGTSTNSNNVVQANPLFVSANPLLPPDFRLSSGSPLIDAGTPVSVWNDFSLNVRPVNSIWDIGPYEYSATP